MAYARSSIVGFIAVVAASGLWYFYEKALADISPASFDVSAAVMFLTVHLVMLTLLLLFARHRGFILFVVIASFAPVLLFFGVAPIVVGAGVLLVLAVLHGHSRVQGELRNRLNFNVFVLLRQGLPVILTGFSLVLAAGYYIHTQEAPEQITIRNLIPQSVIKLIIRQTVPLPDPSLNPDVLYELVTVQTERLFEPYRRFVPLAFAIGLFLFLRTVALPYGWIISAFSAVIVYALKKIGIITRVEEEVTKERFEWA